MKSENTGTPIEEYDVEFYDGKKPSQITNRIIREVPVKIYLNGHNIITIACAGIHLKELAAGFLKSEGIIEVSGDIEKIYVSNEDYSVHVFSKSRDTLPDEKYILSSGARESKQEAAKEIIMSDIHISAESALKLMKDHLYSTKIHMATHGTHCSSLADTTGRIIISREDIGRHNTIDMLGGYSLFHKIECSDKIVLTTGRVSSEIVSKIWKSGIPIILSRSVPTSRAIALSLEAGITVIGYMRDGKMNIYSNKERVVF
ncbi:MAG: formate dehydrogenase accessory sulfurtransferase FdhD [Syntrophobacterales bacterium]|nr:formate dehydrogenase accessory sulfurtransferase FdhD [Syntrophobacterales bacterium]